jgi:hypothetical protein
MDEWTEKQARKFCEENERSMSWFLGYAAKCYFASAVAKEPRPATARAVEDARQIHLEDAIAASKKAASKTAKHK